MENKITKQHNSSHSLTLRAHYETQLIQAKECESISTAVSITIDKNIVSISEIIRNGNIDLIQRYIAAEIAEFCSMLPVGRTLSPEAVVNIAKHFSQHADVKNLSVVELKTFLSLALKRMTYGKLYGGFGYDTLLDWFVQFYNERTDKVIEHREQEHSFYTAKEKIQRNRNYGDEWGMNNINQIIKKDDNLQK